MAWNDLKPGGTISTREFNDLADTVESLSLVRSNSLEIRRGPGGFALEQRGAKPILARTTDVSGAGTGGAACYPWEEVYLDGGTATAVVGGQTGSLAELSAKEVNGNTNLSSGTLIEITLDPSGEFYTLDAGGRNQGITVKESDGTPSYATITSLEIDQAQGGVVTQPGTGRAKVSWADASTTQAGVVSTGLQLLAGYKRFTTGVITSGIHLGYFASVDWPSTTDVTDEYHSIISVSGYFQVSGSGNLGSGEGFGMSRADNGNSWSTSAGSILFSNGRVQAATQFSIGDGDITAACELGQTGTYAGMVFTGGILTGGSFTGVTSVAGSGGTTGLSVSGGPITSTGTLTLGGTLVPANGGTGLTTTPADGTLLTGTGSGYQQSSTVTHSLRWGID